MVLPVRSWIRCEYIGKLCWVSDLGTRKDRKRLKLSIGYITLKEMSCVHCGLEVQEGASNDRQAKAAKNGKTRPEEQRALSHSKVPVSAALS